MNNLYLEIVKITSIGCNKHFATFSLNNSLFCCFISKSFYDALKVFGVPTSQKLRWSLTNCMED